MKLRILDDAIRLRLARSEVAAVARGESVEAVTRFPDGSRFVYRLSTANTPAPTARFSNGRMEVTVPVTTAAAWAIGDEVAIAGEQPTAAGVLRILIEKDFACLRPREGEDPSDRYPNPKSD